VFIYSLGDVLEAYAVDRARGALKALMDLMPKEALVRRDGEDLTLPVEEVRIGEIIVIKPAERIALDGQVVSGSSAVDEAPITGEPIPVVSLKFKSPNFPGTRHWRGSSTRLKKPRPKSPASSALERLLVRSIRRPCSCSHWG